MSIQTEAKGFDRENNVFYANMPVSAKRALKITIPPSLWADGKPIISAWYGTSSFENVMINNGQVNLSMADWRATLSSAATEISSQNITQLDDTTGIGYVNIPANRYSGKVEIGAKNDTIVPITSLFILFTDDSDDSAIYYQIREQADQKAFSQIGEIT